MFRFSLQRFLGRQVRCPHIAATVADQRLIDVLAAAVDVDAPVVNLDLLIRFEIIPDQHFLLSTDKGGPHLDW